MTDYVITITREIEPQDVDDVLDSALRWSSYWCDQVEISKPAEEARFMCEVLTRGGELTFYLSEPYKDGGETEFVLTLDKFIQGIEDNGKANLEDFDGPDSDACLQYALFGEVVYG